MCRLTFSNAAKSAPTPAARPISAAASESAAKALSGEPSRCLIWLI